MVAGWTLNRRAASAAVLSPSETIFRISACCCSKSFGRRPARPWCVPEAWRARTLRRPPLSASSSVLPKWSCRSPRSGCGIPPGFPELLHDCEHVAERARQPIQLPNNDYVTLAKLIEEPLELGAGPNVRRKLSRERCARIQQPSALPFEQRCPGHLWRRGRNRSTLRKCIANRNDSAIPFRNTRVLGNSGTPTCCKTACFVQPFLGLPNDEALPRSFDDRLGHFRQRVDFENSFYLSQ